MRPTQDLRPTYMLAHNFFQVFCVQKHLRKTTETGAKLCLRSLQARNIGRSLKTVAKFHSAVATSGHLRASHNGGKRRSDETIATRTRERTGMNYSRCAPLASTSGQPRTAGVDEASRLRGTATSTCLVTQRIPWLATPGQRTDNSQKT
jgi:hypothetical protein